MKKIIALTAFATYISASATTLPTSKEEFCGRFNDIDIMTAMSHEPSNLMSFRNQGGLFNGGLCWWHSRFQRNIFYLSIFRPDLNRPNANEVKSLIKEIRNGERVITIPGFSSFSEFSDTYQKEILAELSSWQLYDGVILSQWITGLRGQSKIKPELLKKMMDETFQYIEVEKRIAYQKLQIKGITAHAWLMVGMKKINDNYEIGYIDSNYPKMTSNYSYKKGDDSFFMKSYGNFVPYLEFTREEAKISSVAKAFCGKERLSLAKSQNWARDYQLDLKDVKKDN
jgi:hypothetical protein